MHGAEVEGVQLTAGGEGSPRLALLAGNLGMEVSEAAPNRLEHPRVTKSPGDEPV